jgi:hypothetical protein
MFLYGRKLYSSDKRKCAARMYSSVWRHALMSDIILFFLSQEPMKSKAPQLHLEYRFYKLLGSHGELKVTALHIIDVYIFLFRISLSVLYLSCLQELSGA